MEPKKEPSTTLIYVSNLPFTTTDEQFRDLFKAFKVKTAYVARRKNGRSKGFGFVNLETENDQKAAIETANNAEIENRKLIAKIAFNDDRRNEKGELKEEFKTQTQTEATPSETVAHVSNLAWTVTNEELKNLFQDITPKSATVASRRNGRSKGFGFVEFNNKEDLERALKLSGTPVSGRNILVQASVRRPNQPRTQRNNRGGNRGGNNGGNRGGNRGGNNGGNRGGNNGGNRGGNNGGNRGGNNRGGDFRVVRRTERSENTLYISNLPFELDDNDLRQIFQEFNPKNAKIPVRRGGKSKGYGFVEFNNANDQNEALKALDQSEVNGRLITIKVSQPTQRNNNNNRPPRNNNQNRPPRNNNNRPPRNNNNRPPRNNNQNRPPRNENREVSTNMVYVSNLPFSVDDNALSGIFKGLNVVKAYVSRRRNGFSRGYGFVEFSNTEEQQTALKNNGMDVQGRPIVVQAAFKVENKTISN
jgi:RNA recognition motif-containing protein